MQTDHLGNQFKSVSEMVKYYGIPRPTYISRLKLGWSLEEALTVPSIKDGGNFKATNSLEGLEDHLGNRFNNKSQMARYWGISPAQLHSRLSQGMTLEEALTKQTTPRGNYSKRGVVDHLGVKYSSIPKLAKAYNIKVITLNDRLKRGWSIERALTTPVDNSCHRKSKDINSVRVQDHKGNWYDSYYSMAKAYDLSFSTLYGRLVTLGWSVEKALLTPTQKRKVGTRKEGIS